MPKYLIDANLPYKFSLWQKDGFIHIADINPFWSDTEIWNYAKEHNLIIVTKDADFSNRIIITNPPPKVIYLKIGNMKIQELHSFLNSIWSKLEQEIENHKLIIVHQDYMEMF